MSTVAAVPGPSSLLGDFRALHSYLDKKSAVLNHVAQSERLVMVRPASRLEVRPRPEMISSGIPELDALTGGLPRGCLTEICGPASSGKSSVLLATLAAATQRGEACVLIDASDSFDPASGAAAGVEFGELLWVRCGKTSYAARRSSSAKTVSSVPSTRSARSGQAKVGLRSSDKNSQTGAPHTSVFFAEGGACDFADDVRRATYDGFPDDRRPRTDDNLTYDESPHDARRRTQDGFADGRRPRADSHHTPEFRLEQVLKATDLVLHSGGFGLVALDLVGIPETFVRRIPLVSWFRFVRAVEHTKTALLVISEIPCAQTCAALAMEVCAKPSAINRQPSGKPHASSSRRNHGEIKISPVGTTESSPATPSHAQVLRERQIEAEIVRSRLEQNQYRKPMRSANAAFKTQAVRAG